MNVIKAILLERDMTIQQLADLCGVTKRTLEPYVSGKYEWANARGKLLLAVSDALDIDPHLLVNGKVEINLYQKK